MRRVLLLTVLAACAACVACTKDEGPALPRPTNTITVPTDAPTAPPTAAPTSAPTTAPTAVPTVTDAGATGTVHFIAVGDTGRGDANQARVRDAMVGKCASAPCDFVVLLGDNFYLSGVSSVTDPQWTTKFETMYASVRTPFFYAVLGNHDYGGGGNGNEFIKGQYEVDYSARSAKWRMPAPYYTFTAGPAQLFAADSNMQMYARDGDQRTQMSAWVDASTARWKIALAHHPYKSNGPHGNAGTYDGHPETKIFNGVGVKAFDETVFCGKVDVLLSGHDHVREWMEATCQGTELVVAGAGSEVTSLPGRQPARFQSARQGFAYVTVTPTDLTVDFVNETGATDFSRTIHKGP